MLVYTLGSHSLYRVVSIAMGLWLNYVTTLAFVVANLYQVIM